MRLDYDDFYGRVPSTRERQIQMLSSRVQNILHRANLSISRFASFSLEMRRAYWGFGEEAEADFKSYLDWLRFEHGICFRQEVDPLARRATESVPTFPK